MLATQYVHDIIQHETLQDCPFELEDTPAVNPVNHDPNVSYFMQPPSMSQLQQNIAMCVHANLASSNTYCTTNLPFHPQSDYLSEYKQWPIDQSSESSNEIYPESPIRNQPEICSSLPYFPDTPFLPVGIHQGDELQVSPLNVWNAESMPKNFVMHTAENGSFFIENKLSEISGFVYGNSDWGFSHPLGHVLKNKRGLLGVFILHSGNAW